MLTAKTVKLTEKQYRDNVYQLIDAIGIRMENTVKDVVKFDLSPQDHTAKAARYVINTIVNPSEDLQPSVFFTTPINDLCEHARHYELSKRDKFVPYHRVMLDFVNAYESRLRDVRAVMHECDNRETVTQRIAFNDAAEVWGQDHSRQINDLYDRLPVLRGAQ